MSSENGALHVREVLMAHARKKARELALQGRSADEIVGKIDGGDLTGAEQEPLRKIACSEVASADAKRVLHR
jgi:hypothetical protein